MVSPQRETSTIYTAIPSTAPNPYVSHLTDDFAFDVGSNIIMSDTLAATFRRDNAPMVRREIT